jgi:hypothetical protein
MYIPYVACRCVIENELTPNQSYQVSIAIRATSVAVTIDGRPECTMPKSQRQLLSNVHVYASDPWYDPAGGKSKPSTALHCTAHNTTVVYTGLAILVRAIEGF